MPKARTKLSHIVLALDADSQSLGAIKRAVELAQQLQAEITGTFIEDLDLIHSAQLPFTVEIIAHNAQERKVSASHMERSLKARAEQARQLLEKLATQAQVKWQFNTIRIKRRSSNLAQLLNSNVLLIPQPNILNHHVPQDTGPHAVYSIYVVVDQSEQSKHCLELARQISTSSGQTIVLLHEPGMDPVNVKNIRVSIDFEISPEHPQFETLKHYCSKHPASLVLLPNNHPWQKNHQLLRKLQLLMQCPFIVINTNHQ